MADTNIRALDATDTTQVIEAVKDWINNLNILDDDLCLEYTEDNNGYGYCLKADGGSVVEEDIVGNFTAEVVFIIYFTTNIVPGNAQAIYKPLNDLSAWFKKNGTAGLDIGERREPTEIITLAMPKDLAGKDEDGNTTFFSVYKLTYDEEAI